MLDKNKKTLDFLDLEEGEASELISLANKYRKNFSEKVREKELLNFIENLNDPTSEDIERFSRILNEMGVDFDKTDLVSSIKPIVDQQKLHREQIRKLELEYQKYSYQEIPDIETLDRLILKIKNRYAKLADVSEDLKEAARLFEKIKHRSKIQLELDTFLKNFINPTRVDIEDFIDTLDIDEEIIDKAELIKDIVNQGQKIKKDQDTSSKFMLIKRAVENIDSQNLVVQYRAIKNIHSLCIDNDELLNWIHKHDPGILEEISQKLIRQISANSDAAINGEAKLTLDILMPFIRKKVQLSDIDLVCPECQANIQPGWRYCISCESKINWGSKNFCPNCGVMIDSDWMVCPSCHQDISSKILKCTNCGEQLDSDWNICPYCGLKVH